MKSKYLLFLLIIVLSLSVLFPLIDNKPSPTYAGSLSFSDQFILFALDNIKGSFICDPVYTYSGIAGSILFILSQRGHIEIQDNLVIPTNSFPKIDRLLIEAMRLIKKSKRTKSTKFWIKKLANNGVKYKNIIIDRLIKQDILTGKRTKGQQPLILYPTRQPKLEEHLKANLSEILSQRNEMSPGSKMMISLIYACKLQKEVFAGKWQEPLIKEKITRIFRESHIANAVKDVIGNIWYFDSWIFYKTLGDLKTDRPR